MTYGAEVVILLEANFPTLKMSSFTPSSNHELLGKSLDLIEERREKAVIQLAYCQCKAEAISNRGLSVEESHRCCQEPILGKVGTQLGRAILNYFSSRNRCILLRVLR